MPNRNFPWSLEMGKVDHARRIRTLPYWQTIKHAVEVPPNERQNMLHTSRKKRLLSIENDEDERQWTRIERRVPFCPQSATSCSFFPMHVLFSVPIYSAFKTHLLSGITASLSVVCYFSADRRLGAVFRFRCGVFSISPVIRKGKRLS